MAIVAPLILYFFPLQAISDNKEIPKPAIIATSSVESLVRSEFADDPTMIEIARCESHFRQFNSDGSIHKGTQNPLDTGLYQINLKYHLEASKKLGMDIYTVAGNIAYAKVLRAKNGYTDWSWSASCWNHSKK